MLSRHIAIGLLNVSIFMFPHSGLAQSATQHQVGRLPDGRAYRMDAQGYRLVDQMAELEVTNDDLKRQLRALEDELNEKDDIIEKLKKGKAVESKPIKENSLVEDSLGKKSKSAEPPNCNELVSSLYVQVSRLENQLKAQPATGSAAAVKCDYDSQGNPWKKEAARLQEANREALNQNQLAAEQGKNKIFLEKEATQEIAENLSRDLSSAKVQIARLEKEVSQLRSNLSEKTTELKQLEQREIEIAELQQQLGRESTEAKKLADREADAVKKQSSAEKILGQMQRALEAKDQEIQLLTKAKEAARSEAALAASNAASLQQRLSAREKEYEQLAKRELSAQNELLAANSNTAKLQERLVAKDQQYQQIAKEETAQAKRAALAIPSAPLKTESGTAQSSVRNSSLTTSSSSPVQGMDSMIISEAKKELQRDLASIQEQIVKRKDLLDQLKKRGQPVSISMQPLIAKDGNSLDRLRGEIQSLNQSSELGRIRNGLRQIQQILADDISVLQRLSRL